MRIFFCIFGYLARRKSHNNNSGSGYWERQITYDSYDQPADLEKTQRNNNECLILACLLVPFLLDLKSSYLQTA